MTTVDIISLASMFSVPVQTAIHEKGADMVWESDDVNLFTLRVANTLEETVVDELLIAIKAETGETVGEQAIGMLSFPPGVETWISHDRHGTPLTVAIGKDIPPGTIIQLAARLRNHSDSVVRVAAKIAIEHNVTA